MTLRSTGARATGLLALALSTLPATASFADEKSSTSEEVVVTATRIPTELHKIGSSISVVTAKDLENQQTRFVMDALQSTPGLSISQLGPRGTASSLKIRGQNPEGTLVLIDGIEVSDPSQFQTQFDFASLLVGDLDRIEILRGSQSVLYGGDAVGGVVNILSKRGEGPLTGQVYGEWGSYNTWLYGGRVNGGLANNRIGYNIDAQYFDTLGFSAANHLRPGNTEKDGSHNLSSSGRLDADMTEQVDLKAVYRVTQGTARFDQCGGSFCDGLPDHDDILQYSGRISSGVHLLDNKLNGEFGAAYNRDERHGYSFGSNFYIGDRQKYDFQGSYTFDKDNALVFGAETKSDGYKSNENTSRVTVRNTAFYGLYQTGLFDALYLSAGVRVDDSDSFGTFTTYRGTAAYVIKATGTKIKGSYSTGFRAPSLFELYGICCGDPLLGNKDLGPEKSKSWDAGVEQRFFDDKLRLEVVYFEIDTKNKILFGGAFGTSASNYSNVPGTTRSKGVETTVAWNPTDAFNVDLSYTYNEVKDATHTRLQNRPKNLISGNVNYTFWRNRANINLNARYWSDTLDTDFDFFPSRVVKLGEPALVTLGARVKVLENTELNGRIENLFNQKYETEAGFGTAGQSFYVGLRQSF